MSMDIEIRVDPGDALQKSKAAETALAKVEDGGKKAGDAVSKGMQESAGAAEKAKKAFEGLKERLSEVGEIEGSIGGSVAARFGEAGSLFQKFFSSGAIEAGALVGVGAELVHIRDEYLELSNAARKFAGANADVADTLHQQLDLAGDLHASLEQTIELSTIVKERTEDMNLSQEAAAEFTRSLGEAVELSGHSIGEAGNVINRLAFALESGLPAGKQMKELMREYPPIAEALRESFGKTDKQLIDMANSGHLSMRKFVDSITEAGEHLHIDFDQRTETSAQMFAHWKDTVVVTAGDAMDNVKDVANDAGRNLAAAFAPEALEKNTGRLAEHWDRFFEKIHMSVHIIEDNQKAWQSWLKTFYDVEVEMKEEHAVNYVSKFTDQLENLGQTVSGIATKLTSSEGLHSLITKVDPWAIATEAVKKHTAALSDEEKMYEKIDGPREEQSRGIASIGKLYGEGRITIKQYNDELEKLMALWHEYETVVPSFTGGQQGGAGTGGLGQVANFVPVPMVAQVKNAAETDMWKRNANGVDYKRWEATATDAISGIDLAVKKLMANTLDVAKTIESAITGAFDQLNNHLTEMITTGKTNWGEFASYIEQQLVKIALQEAEAGLIRGVAAAAIAGSAHGSDTIIPHAASGYSARIGGAGGTDSKLFMSWVTPGEQVSIRTPEQVSAAQRAGGGGSPRLQIINRHDTRGELADAFTSGYFDVHFLNVMKRNKTALQSLLKK